MKAEQKRLQLIRLIHVAKRELKMDDDTYRSILSKIGNRLSAKEMSVSELDRVLEHLKQAGFKVRPKQGTIPLATDPQSKMIRGLWLELADMAVVNDRSENALRNFVVRLTRVDSLQWLTAPQASRVIEHLKKWKTRVEKERTNE